MTNLSPAVAEVQGQCFVGVRGVCKADCTEAALLELEESVRQTALRLAAEAHCCRVVNGPGKPSVQNTGRTG